MRRGLLATAAGIVLIANGWGLLSASRNQSEPPGGSLELTERELRLEDAALESTATVLRLNWRVLSTDKDKQGTVAWLNVAKLAELGFDCGVPVSSASARNHYSSMPARPVFLALEFEGDAWQKAGAPTSAETRLFVVDAAREAHRLRERYPNRQRYIICRGILRLRFRDHDMQEGVSLNTPRIEGWIQGLNPGEVFVPRPQSRVLRALLRIDSNQPDNNPPKEPRFAARVCWGANYEPWVEDVRLLNAASTTVKKP